MSQYTTDGVDHPAHYNNHPAGIECVDVVEHYNFNVGNAIKYLWRAGLKPGEDAIKDLEKAAWYVQREIKRLSKPKTVNDIRLNMSVNCVEFVQSMDKAKEQITNAFIPRKNGVIDAALKVAAGAALPPEPANITGVKHRRGIPLRDWSETPTIPVDMPAVIEKCTQALEMINTAEQNEVASEPEKKLQESADLCGTSESDTAPNAEALATYNKLTQQGPCAMCDAATWKSILRRNNGYCTKCKSKLTKKKITQEFEEERAAKPTPDPKDELSDHSAAEYLFTLLKKKFPFRGDFLVQDAMTLIDVSYPCAIKYLKILQRQGKLYTKSPHDLQDMQKWHITKDKTT